ncbi:MAG TPA: 3-phosphoshikimate 1-carboxyvinyltransferase [Actinocrinis sp.]|uniref:3-phosphoshikimate 1-carboxyvinyltransferase n=1 Tax=Actinocrinis sp. TaxID=1920516 RepID=UPI002DDCEC78|nr:3-phosphoshikimate 1-carboxyvinyltransferase [Actinocrinis sp.]HEV3173184.1 3-phosphoshikimate 1-carboxyvinyltransferase [Actinocrinis sp.]
MTNPTSLWPAPTSDGPVDAVVAVPGSKSVTNRALLLAALADGPSTLRRPLRSRDTLLMAAALRALGTGIEDLPDGSWRVTPAAGALTGDVSVDVGNAGTVMRFLPPVAALAAGAVRFDGDPRSHERPVRALIEALRALGADVDDSGRPGHFPLSVLGRGRLAGGLVEIDSSASSQFVSALLLVGARFERGVEVRHVGDRLPSLPHIQMTVQMLREAGVTVDDDEPERWAVAPGPIRARDLTIEPDLSNAAPFLAAALVTGGRVTVPDWPEHTTQPGARLREIFTQMGARCTLEAAGLTVAGDGGVHGVDLDLSNEAELTPTIAAVAALADSPSRLRGIGHIRLHETDRIAALAKELGGLGADVMEGPDELVISPRPLHGGEFATYEDHRLATAAAVIGLAVEGVLVENVATTAKTLPDFPGRWAAMLGGVPYTGSEYRG